MVNGEVAAGFEPVRDAFAANFDERGEVGAAVCVYVEGRAVVDLWDGVADTTDGREWAEDTVVGVFSSTKGVTASCAALLVERGLLDPDAAVATYWPEFAANGKESITVSQVMSHQAGLPYVDGDFTLDEALSWDPVVERLAAQPPIWEPGTQHGYHMRTYGWLVGEIVRRITGRTVGQFLHDEIASPLSLDFWIGLPEEIEPRVARLVPPVNDLGKALERFGESLLLAKVFSNPGGHFNYDDMWNTRALHACELPSSNGIGDARALARLYASMVGGGIDGIRLVSDDTIKIATTEQVRGTDAVIMAESAFGLGFMLGRSFGAANPRGCFGHAGAGGSLSFADPDRDVGFGYVMNDLRFDPNGDPRSETLVRAVYDVLGKE